MNEKGYLNVKVSGFGQKKAAIILKRNQRRNYSVLFCFVLFLPNWPQTPFHNTKIQRMLKVHLNRILKYCPMLQSPWSYHSQQEGEKGEGGHDLLIERHSSKSHRTHSLTYILLEFNEISTLSCKCSREMWPLFQATPFPLKGGDLLLK